jgi:curved DNA-binding protein CbpA
MGVANGKTQENLYQILGVQPNASQGVLDAAYRRLVRIHTGEYLDDAALVAGPEPSDPVLARVEQAFRILSNPLKRWAHDEELKEAQQVPLSEKELEEARKRIEPSDAWLSYQRLENGWLFIRVGWALEFTAIHNAVNAAVPESGRTYNARLNEWRIDPRYEEELAAIFTNFKRAHVQAPPRQVGPIYQRMAYIPTKPRRLQPRRSWPFLIIGGLIAATVGALLFPANRVVPVSVQATTTAIALINSYEPLESNFPPPTAAPTPVMVGALRHPTVNLRERPEVDAPVLSLLSSDRSYQLIGRLEDSSWYVAAADDAVGWMAAWTVIVDGEAERLPVFESGQSLPFAAGTPVAVAGEAE